MHEGPISRISAAHMEMVIRHIQPARNLQARSAVNPKKTTKKRTWPLG